RNASRSPSNAERNFRTASFTDLEDLLRHRQRSIRHGSVEISAGEPSRRGARPKNASRTADSVSRSVSASHRNGGSTASASRPSPTAHGRHRYSESPAASRASARERNERA